MAQPRWLAGFMVDGMSRPFPNIVVPARVRWRRSMRRGAESAQVS
jgi:hypothetical protein